MPTPILMPALSPTMEEGTLARWLVKEGDSVQAGDVIAEIETDKATMEVEAVDEGTIGKLLVAEGTEGVKVNAEIAIILEEGEDADAIETAQKPAVKEARSESRKEPEKKAAPEKPAAQAKPEPVKAQPSATAPARASQSSATAVSDTRIKASPLARRLAAQAGIDLASLPGSGPNGRIIKADVEAATQGKVIAAPMTSGQPATAEVIPLTRPAMPTDLGVPEGSYDEVKLDGMRKIVARRMTESKQQVPHFPLTIDCRIDNLLSMRKDLNSRAPEGDNGYKLSVNDFVIRASALALKKVPGMNASFAGDKALMHHHADIAVAVAVEGGLFTPIIWQAENKGLQVISSEMKDFATRARDRKLLPEEYQGGTFSISNLGMFGVKEFAAVINQPHGGILAVGAGEQRPVVKDGALAIATVMTCTLSVDHRVADGAVGAEWLKVFKAYIEDPVTMLL